MSKQSCFIIMPLTTPDQHFEKYNGDSDHFIHVLDHLFKPAIKAAGMDPIPPISKVSEVIHGDIIRNLETADIVLCDMSILNPNVFFELGIRTALNKSVAMIRDNVTARVPFDTTIINYHEYDCGLEPWKLDEEVEKLTNHLKDCMGNGSGNSLWGYFSMTQQAEVPSDAPEVEKQYAYLIKQIEILRDQMNDISGHPKPEENLIYADSMPRELLPPGAKRYSDIDLDRLIEQILLNRSLPISKEDHSAYTKAKSEWLKTVADEIIDNMNYKKDSE